MKHLLIVPALAVLAIGSFAAVDARADYYGNGAATTTTTTTYQGPAPVMQKAPRSVTHRTTEESYTAIGTRKVGIVGSRPYPLEASHVESSTVETTRHGRVMNSAVTSSTTTTGSPEVINYQTGGGTYYTDSGTQYYSDPALNIKVRNTGSFNN